MTHATEPCNLLTGKHILILTSDARVALDLVGLLESCDAVATVAAPVGDMPLPETQDLVLIEIAQDSPPPPLLLQLHSKHPELPMLALVASAASAHPAPPLAGVIPLGSLTGPGLAALLAPHLQPPEQAPTYDSATLDGFITMAGPALAHQFLVQLHADLAEAAASLRGALSPPDWRSLRAASHVLISLSGTCGAHALEADARTFNQNSKDQDLTAISTAAPALLIQVEALIRDIAAHPGANPAKDSSR